METPGVKTTWQAETKVDRQSGEELSKDRNTRWRNNSTRQRQMEASLCCGNGPQWPLKTEEEEEDCFDYMLILRNLMYINPL